MSIYLSLPKSITITAMIQPNKKKAHPAASKTQVVLI
jgi:hypothetical protein